MVEELRAPLFAGGRDAHALRHVSSGQDEEAGPLHLRPVLALVVQAQVGGAQGGREELRGGQLGVVAERVRLPRDPAGVDHARVGDEYGWHVGGEAGWPVGVGRCFYVFSGGACCRGGSSQAGSVRAVKCRDCR